jgi:hypothetical protein
VIALIAPVILSALVVTDTVGEVGHVSMARIAGVLVAGAAFARRFSMTTGIALAMVTTAILRSAGL